jgi:hypothetical protein
MSKKNTFDILMLIARPAAGKSEIIDYLKRIATDERQELMHIRDFEEIDDFPMLWIWFEEDDILSEMGYPKMHTDENENFLGDHLWDLLIRRICLEYKKKIRDNPDYHDTHTTIIEFARGKEHGGFQRAFEHLSQEVLERTAMLYVNVSWEESLRKNRARYNPLRPDSILEHGLSDEKLEYLYRDMDWDELTAGNPEYITIQGFQVPYIVFDNQDDVTTTQGNALGKRLEESLGRLWALYQPHIK